MNRLERAAFVGMVLVWAGVILFGIGLFLAFRTAQERQAAYAEATAIAQAVTAPVITTPLPPTATPVTYPAGWATATPTVRPTDTPILKSEAFVLPPEMVGRPEAEIEQRMDLEAGPAMLLLTPVPDPTEANLPQPAPQVQATPVSPTPTPLPPLGPPDRIVIPAIGVDSPVVPVGWHVVTQGNVQYSVWDVADYAAGWHKTSAIPGERGNMVISGHNNIRGEVFRDLIDLKLGDQILIYVGEQVYYYEVTEKHLLEEKGQPLQVRRENAQWIAPKEDERLTLVTCWPYTGNSHRLVVVARPTTAASGTRPVQE